MDNARAFRQHCAIIRLSAAFLGENSCDDTATMSEKSESTERQGLLAMNPGQSKGSAVTSTHNRTIGRLSRQKCILGHRHYAIKMSVNGVSMIRCYGPMKWEKELEI